MAKTYRVYQVDAFTKNIFTGNPAGVVTNADGLTDEEMQKIARELNNSETAFIFSENCVDCDIQVRFFTPTTEVPICGHATIAAHYVNALEKKFTGHTKVMQKTGAGILPVDIYKENGDYRVVMTQGNISINSPLPGNVQEKILKALDLSMDMSIPALPISIASTGHSKVMVGIIGINCIEKLHKLHPDMSALAAISSDIGCNGYYVFTIHPGEDSLIHGRMFAPAIGIAEDPVTGNANGPLGAYLVHVGYADRSMDNFSFKATQGEAIGRSGTIKVDVTIKDKQPVKVCVSGNAVIAFKTEITL